MQGDTSVGTYVSGASKVLSLDRTSDELTFGISFSDCVVLCLEFKGNGAYVNPGEMT